MDFITGFPRTSRQHDSIMVVVDRLTKVVHFILVKYMYSSSDLAQVFLRDVVRLHVVLKKIVLDKILCSLVGSGKNYLQVWVQSWP